MKCDLGEGRADGDGAWQRKGKKICGKKHGDASPEGKGRERGNGIAGRKKKETETPPRSKPMPSAQRDVRSLPCVKKREEKKGGKRSRQLV